MARACLNKTLQCRVPVTLAESIEKAANGEQTTTSSYARRAIVERLRADGYLPQASATA